MCLALTLLDFGRLICVLLSRLEDCAGGGAGQWACLAERTVCARAQRTHWRSQPVSGRQRGGEQDERAGDCYTAWRKSGRKPSAPCRPAYGILENGPDEPVCREDWEHSTRRERLGPRGGEGESGTSAKTTASYTIMCRGAVAEVAA